MNLNHLAIFHAVAEELNLSRAAERLFISQPAVSKQLAELERSLQTRLFDRLPQGVRLTEAGQLLLIHSAQLFTIEKEAERSIAELQGLKRGRLAIGASTTIGDYLLPEILAHYHHAYPGIEITLEIANTEQIQRKLLTGVLDIGMTEGFVNGSDLEVEVFWEDALIAITAPNNPVLREGVIPAARLCQEPFILREAGSGTRAVVEHAFRQIGLTPETTMSLGSTEAIKQAVISGAGIAVVSLLSIKSELLNGQLIAIPISDLKIVRPLHRLHLHGKYSSKALTSFLSYIEHELQERRRSEPQN